jgi:LPS-assembly protein
MTITAQRMWTTRDGTLHAEGGVVVQGEGVTVRSETLRFDPNSDTLYLAGSVTMDEAGGGSFKGDSLVLDLADLTGGISRGEIIVVPNGFRVRGEDIKRLAPEEFSVRKGVFTSCSGDCPDWSFTASEINVRKEGYLTAKHAAFRILNVPVFYTPYLYYPVKTKRQTGLLLPEIRFSDDTGLESAWPFFLALGPHADATFTPRTFSRDSLGLDGEVRYRLHHGGGGDLSGFAVEGDDDDRWYYRG